MKNLFKGLLDPGDLELLQRQQDKFDTDNRRFEKNCCYEITHIKIKILYYILMIFYNRYILYTEDPEIEQVLPVVTIRTTLGINSISLFISFITQNLL